MNQAGIEKINIYASPLYLSQEELAKARGWDSPLFTGEYRLQNRSLIPTFEDTLTMAVNAASAILTPEDKQQIGLLIFATESSADFSAPASAMAHWALGLSPHVRNFEIKFACYAGVAATDIAMDWLEAGNRLDQKALVLIADLSRKHFRQPEEMVAGCSAAAILLSWHPEVMAWERLHTGIYSRQEYDFFRPTARLELVDSSLSLFAYLEALEGAYRQYAEKVGSGIDPESHFDYLIYHMPFAGMAYQAHRTLLSLAQKRGQKEILASFQRKVLPSLHFASQMGGSYGASNAIGLCGLIHQERDRLQSGNRIGFYSYGSGSIGQFYSGILLPGAVEVIAALDLERHFSSRRRVTVEEYEEIENERDHSTESMDYLPSLDVPQGCFETMYQGRNRLILKRIAGYRREYEWC